MVQDGNGRVARIVQNATGIASQVRHADRDSVKSPRSVHGRFGLKYLVIDCAETPDGALFVFEVDPGAIVHSMDPPDMFPYKVPAMQKVFQAFQALLKKCSVATQSVEIQS